MIGELPSCSATFCSEDVSHFISKNGEKEVGGCLRGEKVGVVGRWDGLEREGRKAENKASL